jgi:hypothetical protein
MRKRLLAAIAALAVLGLAAGAVPAFTADNGTVTVSVTAQAPAAPCLTVAPGTVDFGTLPFSRPGIPNISSGNASLTTTNCGTANQNLLGSATDATGPTGPWFLATSTGTPNPCGQGVEGANSFFLRIAPLSAGAPFDVLFLSRTPTLVPAPLGGPAVFPAGSSHSTQLRLYMPCEGSEGAGETKTLTATFTAVVA